MRQKPCLFLIFRETTKGFEKLEIESIVSTCPSLINLLVCKYVPPSSGSMAVSLPVSLCEKFPFSFQLQFWMWHLGEAEEIHILKL